MRRITKQLGPQSKAAALKSNSQNWTIIYPSPVYGERINPMAIKSGEIFLEIGKHAPDDPMWRPSLSFTEKFRLGGKNLVLLP